MALTRAAIVDAALHILDEFGLADLSMRRIATSLGVQPGALYWHLDNKQSLLTAVAAELLRDLRPPAGPQRPALRTYATALRSQLLARRDGAEVVSSALAMRLPMRSPVAELREVLVQLPMPAARADAAAALVVHFVIGQALDEQGYVQAHALGISPAAPEDFGARFAHGLDLLLDGIDRARNT